MLCLMKISLVTMYIQCAQQLPKLSWSASRQALHWPERKALQSPGWTEPSPPANSAQKGSLQLMPSAALHSRLCHWQPNPSVLPLASAITSPPTQARWKHWHSAQTQGAARKGRLSKLPPHGESSLILFSGRDKFFRSWPLMTLVNPFQLRIFCDLVIFDYSLLTGSESKFSLS